MKATRIYFVLAFSLVLAWTIPTAPASAADKPVQIFILAGQSNMVGHGKTRDGLNPEYDLSQPQSATNRREIPGGIGGLAWAVKTMPDTFGPNGVPRSTSATTVKASSLIFHWRGVLGPMSELSTFSRDSVTCC